MNLTGVLLLLIIYANPVFGDTSTREERSIPLTLEDCTQIALRQATSVLKGQNEVTFSGSQVIQGYAQFLPTLDLSASTGLQAGTTLFTFNGKSRVTTAGQNASYTVSAALNIFNGLSDLAGLNAALKRRDSAQESLEWAKQQVVLDVTQSFLQVILDEKELEIAQKNLKASQERLKLLKAKTRVGSAAIADLYRQDAQTSADTLALANARAKVRDDQTLLIKKLRIDPIPTYHLILPDLKVQRFPLADRPLPELIQKALETRPDVRSALLTTEAFNWEMMRARGDYYPKLNLNLGRTASGVYLDQQIVNGVNTLNYSQSDLLSQLGTQGQNSVSLTLTWNLFDRFLTKVAVDRAQLIRDNSELDLENDRLQVNSDIRIAYNDYQTAWDQIQTARLERIAAEQAYKAISGQFEVGSATFLDVLTAQSALVQAESNQAQAEINLKLQEKNLQYATGMIEERNKL